jgi:predicted nucleotide-binding protein
LKFSALHAGYGEHLFNEIARDIISSDIAVFETSDIAPNVFIEIGVALTWGSRVFLIKDEKCPKPPSDISGQTYADYQNNGMIFTDPEHSEKLYRMVERAIQKKG